MGGFDFAGSQLGEVLCGAAAKVLAFGSVGGLSSLFSGGKFGHGFVSAGLGAAVGGSNIFGESAAGKALLSATIGGTSSKLTGGKFANGAATAAFASLISSAASAATGKQEVAVNGKGKELSEKQVGKARTKAIKRVNKFRKTVGKAMDGNKGALKKVHRYFGSDADLGAIDSTLETLATDLTNATITPGDPAYIARRSAQLGPNRTVGAYVDSSVPDTIFYNPTGFSSTSELAASLAHEGAHLSGVGHQFDASGSIFYGQSAAKELAKTGGFSRASDNASNYGCAVFSFASGC